MKIKLFLFLAFLSFSIAVFSQTTNYKIADLPLQSNIKGTNETLLFYLTGDGGMNSFSNKLIETLSARNYKIISLDSKKYFWDGTSPEKMGKELSNAIEFYLKQTRASAFCLLGYSFGADASILLASNLSPILHEKLAGVILMSPSMATDLDVKVSDLIGFGAKTVGKYKTLAFAKKLNKPIFCIVGADEDNAFYTNLSISKTVRKKMIPGSHKYNNDISLLTRTVISALTSF